MTTLRRFLVLQLLMLWQGGFLFYATFVVPAGTEVLGSAEAQGTITTRVTDSLNRVGVAALALMLWEVIATWSGPKRRVRVAIWLVMVLGQGILFYLHLELDGMMDGDRSFVVRRASFYPVHRCYLWTSTVQWVAGLAFVWFMLHCWRTPIKNPR